jgi:hypothetical protein
VALTQTLSHYMLMKLPLGDLHDWTRRSISLQLCATLVGFATLSAAYFSVTGSRCWQEDLRVE